MCSFLCFKIIDKNFFINITENNNKLYTENKILKKKNLKITNYDISCIIYLSSLLLTFNFINIEYTLSIWLLNGICLSRALSK